MSYIKKLTILWLIIIFIFVSIGCPARKPGGQTSLEDLYSDEPTLSVFIAETGEIQEMVMEEYLMGVVAAEMDPTWPIEALAAQAILARTFTLKKMEEGGVEQRGTDASTDVEEFQAYDAEKINQQVQEAISSTRGQVATYHGRLINGWFHADAGGKTAASAEEGLAFNEEETPYITSVEDPGFEITLEENKSWTARVPLFEVRQAVKVVVGSDPGEIQTIEVVKKGPSGRAMQVRIGNATISGPALRLALDSTVVRSTLWNEVGIEGGELVISGQGYGHGVGMSQWGARALAEQGNNPQDIVKYFFKDIEIKQLWN
jgi:stage II sporulation protein D